MSVFMLAVLLAGCAPVGQPAENAPTEPVSQQTAPTEQTISATAGGTRIEDVDPISREAQLLCEAESLEEARALAELYGITLVGYRNGVARFYTEEDPYEVISRGKENGWQELALNRINSLL